MSFLNNLRTMVGLKPKQENKAQKVPMDAEAFNKLSAKFLACEDQEQKAQIWNQMCNALPKALFLAPMCFEGDNPGVPVNDRILHTTGGVKWSQYAICEGIVTKGNPGYKTAKKRDKRRMHLLTVDYHQTKEKWLPLFTDFSNYLPVFGQRHRVTLITYDEARRFAAGCKGIVINMGKNEIRLNRGK